MRIRSITSFFDPLSPQANDQLETLASFSQSLHNIITGQVMPVLSKRLATPPFPLFLAELDAEQQFAKVKMLSNRVREMGWDYLSIGPALPNHPWSYAAIPGLLGITEDLFCSAIVADESRFYPTAVRASAQVIKDVTHLRADGFANLRFAALANVPAGTPFFPAAYHKPGGRPAISLAVECADAALSAFDGATDVDTARKTLLNNLEEAAQQITTVFKSVPRSNEIEFLGFDFSPAPFPEDWCSLGGAIEKIGLEHIGGCGSLGAVAIIADTLDRGNWQRAGFNGMMLPVLEDSVLARRAEEGLLSIKDLLLYSTICGTGLDTIPLAGDTTLEQLEAVIMDIAVLSVRLDKPLTARLMPIPGKKVGDRTSFDFEYFANSRVIPLEGQKISFPLRADQSIQLIPRHKSK